MRGRSWRGTEEGEYRVARRWRWAQAAARVYEAFHRRTGAAALLLKPGRPGDWAPAPRPWEARVVSTPRALALELRPGALRNPADVQEVTLGLHRLANALAQVEEVPAAQEALAGEVARAREWRARWAARPAYVAALACAAVVALLAAPRYHVAPHMAPPPAGVPAQLAPAVRMEEFPVLATRRPLPTRALALPMPPEPFRGQEKPDARGQCEQPGARVINGGCWLRLADLVSPCGKGAYDHKGGCWAPVFPPMREPQAALP